jgi:hypothetical protein
MSAADFEIVIDADGRRKKVLRDGARLRVPMFLRDGQPNPTLSPTQAAIAANRRQLSDQELASCRPGFRFATTARRDAKAEAYALYDAEVSNMWKTGFGGDPRLTGAGSQGAIGQREGDICTVRGPQFPDAFGSPGHLQRRNGELVCVPDDGDPAAARRSSDAKARLRARVDPDADEDEDDDDERVSVAQASSDHQQRMAQIYDALDQELREAWRTP